MPTLVGGGEGSEWSSFHKDKEKYSIGISTKGKMFVITQDAFKRLMPKLVGMEGLNDGLFTTTRGNSIDSVCYYPHNRRVCNTPQTTKSTNLPQLGKRNQLRESLK